MPRDYRLYLEDILSSIDRVQAYVLGLSFQDFSEDPMRVDAVMRNLEIIGEASKRLPDELRRTYPEGEWRKITGFRDMVAHEYFGVDLEIVWDVVKTKLTPLRALVSVMIDEAR